MRRANLIAFALVAVFTIGCGGNKGKLDTVEVSGTITYKGKPVEGATVVFESGEGAAGNTEGTTDGTGKYVFKASLGKNKVSVSKVAGGGGPKTPDEAMQGMMGQTKQGGGGGGGDSSQGNMKYGENSHELPQKYAQPRTSGLTASVTSNAKSNVFNFKLEGEITQGTSSKSGGGGGGGGPGGPGGGGGPGGPGGGGPGGGK